MIEQGTIVKGTNRSELLSGVVVKSKTHKRDTEATVAEVLFQIGTNERAIYVYVEKEFHLIKDTHSRGSTSNIGGSMNQDTLIEALNVNAVIALINQKFAENYENEDKANVLTEVLNDVKLLLQPTANSEVH